MAIRIDFIIDFTYSQHFYFSENAKANKKGSAQELDFQQILAI